MLKGRRILALVDTGSTLSLINQRFYESLKQNVHDKHRIIETPNRRKLIAANASPIKVQTSIACDVNVDGLHIPAELIVVSGLTHQIILGIDWLEAAQATIDIQEGLLKLYKGQIVVPLIQMTNDVTVVNAATIVIPPNSQAQFPVKAKSFLKPGTYAMQAHPQMPCKSILVAHAVVSAHHGKTDFPCCVVNPSDRPIKFRKGTPIGLLAPAEVLVSQKTQASSEKSGVEPSLEQMKQAIAEKKISLEETAVTGEDLEKINKMPLRQPGFICSKFRGPTGVYFSPF